MCNSTEISRKTAIIIRSSVVNCSVSSELPVSLTLTRHPGPTADTKNVKRQIVTLTEEQW